MMEVELKARVSDPEATRGRLESFCRLDRDFDKRDAYWQGPRRLEDGDRRGFRLRTDGGDSFVTFKDKRLEGGIEVNCEREFTVSDQSAFVEFAWRLGCEPHFEKRKRGSRYEAVAGAASGTSVGLELAEIEGIGWFLEIEALVPENDPGAVARAQGEIRSLLAQAGIGEEAIEPRFYSELLMEAGRVARR